MVPPPEERNLTHSPQEDDLLLGPQPTAQERKSASVNEATVWVPILPRSALLHLGRNPVSVHQQKPTKQLWPSCGRRQALLSKLNASSQQSQALSWEWLSRFVRFLISMVDSTEAMS